jgi:hypothetical protein
MAPEQMEGLAVPASDQYALAIMVYELLVGHPPFQGGLGQVMYQHFNTQPVPPCKLNPHLPSDIDTVMLRALAKKPEERFHSISAFARAFQEAMQSTDAPTIAAERSGSTPDLRATLAISDVEALHGTQRTLTLPDGRRVSVAVPAGAYNGQIIRVDGQSISSNSGKGRALLITLAITSSATEPSVRVDTEMPTIRSSTERSGEVGVPSSSPTPIKSKPTEAASYSSRSGLSGTHQGGLSRGVVILLVLLVLVIIGGSIGFVSLYISASKQTTITSTNATSLVTANVTATTGAQPATDAATSTVPTPSTQSDPYTHTGTLALNDPLQANGANTDWMTGTNSNNATCTFTGGAYQSSQPVDGDFHACFALATDYSNFVYEAQMTIVSGSAGGIVFRASQTNSTFYYFRVGQDGSYDLHYYVDPMISDSHQLTSGNSPAIHTGINQPNIIAVVANGSSFTFYVNQQQIASANDNTFSHGQIGIVAYNQGGTATVVYSNARVWTLP